MSKLFWSHDVAVEKAYIITIVGNELSERSAKRCAQSCDAVGQQWETWVAYNGTSEEKNEILEPYELVNDSFMNMVKVTNHFLTRTEIACTLSHISLWRHCVLIDKPIIILEHDAIMIKKLEHKSTYNAITYLGGREWQDGMFPMWDIPPHASRGPNNHFICRAHAYCIDPQVAKNMLAHVLRMGIYDSADSFQRADLFNITHQGFYAYDAPMGSTMIGREERVEDGKFNPRLEI
jgi:hypothetical protein